MAKVPEEIELSREILESVQMSTQKSRFKKTVLDEPSKDELRKFQDNGADVDRKLFIIIRDRINKTTY